jgi:phosphatidylserine/phosphatidylglycerophosphate/cardiolipin synthase-like enzyme
LRSFYQQFECGVYSDNQEFTAQIKEDFEKIFCYSKLIDEENKQRNNLFYRVKAGIMQLFAPFM